MGAGRTLTSWGNHGKFSYRWLADGSAKFAYRRGASFVISPEMLAEMRAHFSGQLVDAGVSRNPPRDSLNAWLKKRLPDVEVPVAYVGPMLVAEKWAVREGATHLRFQ